jgi:aminoglycoside 6'-N-acetyltransferase
LFCYTTDYKKLEIDEDVRKIMGDNMKYLFQNEQIALRKMEDIITDYELMAKWLSTEEVLDYYEGRSNSFDLEKVIKKFAPRVKGEVEVVPCLIEHSQKPIGYIQYYIANPEEYEVGNTINMKNYRSPYGIDLFIGETDNWNKGIGTTALCAMISYLFNSKNADIIFIDPQTWNKRAIRCYEKSGFIPRGVIKNRELHDGEYKDSLIMAISYEEWKTNN